VLWNAYITAIVAGLSVAIFLPRTRDAPPLALLLPPIIVAALAAAWEASVPRTVEFRLDLFLVIPVLAFVEGVAGIALFFRGRRLREERRLSATNTVPAAICVGAAAFVVVAWIVSHYEVERDTARSDQGLEWAFQAAFRDDATQRRVFGELESDPDHWAGFYVAALPDTYPRRIVINTDGRYWTFFQHEHMVPGRRAADSKGPERFTGRELRKGMAAHNVELIKGPGDGFTLQRVFDGKSYSYAYRREAPPRFPPPAAPQRVKYRGVFSGAVASSGEYRIAQLWIWESEGKRWGKYLWQGMTPGIEGWVVAQRDASIECADAACRQIVVTATGEQPTRFSWISNDTLKYEGGYVVRGQELVLRPGETVPGFLYDLAPLATARDNREWLHVIPAGDVYWTPPAAGAPR
jgi:hypothetical protein